MGALIRISWLTSLASGFLIFTLSTLTAAGQTQPNSWTKPASGNWEEPFWSLGVPPGPNQPIMITNAGWKAVAITPNTARNFPQTLNVYSLTVLSPVDSFNTLLLNYAGVDSPLTVSRDVTIGSNAALTMFNSKLHLAGPPGSGLKVGGVVNHRDFSHLTGTQAEVGWVGPGVYNLENGVVDVGHIWVGGPHGGVMNQNGGILSIDVLHFENGGTYNLRGGDFDALTYTSDGAVFRQEGGNVHRQLEFYRGQYLFTNGVNFGGIKLPVACCFGSDNGDAQAYQAGGTNFGPVQIGVFGDGFYHLIGGVIQSPEIRVGRWGLLHQSDGRVSTPAVLTVHGDYGDRSAIAPASYNLLNGSLSSPGIDVDTAVFHQNGGTNAVAGVLAVGPSFRMGARTEYWLSGGFLTTENTRLDSSWTGGFYQEGGIHRIANELSVAGEAFTRPQQEWTWNGYLLHHGELIVSNIVVHPRSAFSWDDGIVRQSGTIRLIGGQLHAGHITQQFGPLRVEAAAGSTNRLHLPSTLGIVRFGDSRAMTWSGDARLIISGWNGSEQGGGPERVIFGNSASALTPAQVSKISFENPSGFAGFFPARILSTGEVVPDTRTGQNPPHITIRKQSNGAMELTVTGDAGRNYGILRSSNLSDWAFWTNRVATNGAMSAIDTTTNPPRRFYRALSMQ